VPNAKDTDLVVKIDTDSGLARLTWHGGIPSVSEIADRRNGILLLGHGAGGGITTPDLLVVARLARSRAIAVGLVEQPYRVAGKRAPVPAPRLDVAFTAVAQAARAQVQAVGRREPVLLVGGRSSGARVACRTAAAIGAQGVLALAFPLSPPRARGRERPSRLPELLGAGAPVLVVQGERDVFGSADQLRVELDAAKVSGEVSEEVIVSTAVGADHALRKGIDASVITEWLARFLT
jgi:predicted alpha/beta-hydrolase family hydrolase